MNRSSARFPLLAFVVVALAALAAPAWGAKAEWKAGFGKAAITPRQSLWMAGYAARQKPSEGTAMDLYARAVALEDRRGNRAVIVGSDLLGFPRSVSEPIAERLRQRFGLRREQVLFNSSHTHAGPVIRESLFSMYPLSDQQKADILAYTEWLREQVEEAVAAAMKDLAPASLSLGRGQAGFAINRRLKRGDQYVINVNPEGPVDHEVTVLRVATAEGKLRGVLFSYACHNTTLGGDFYKFHGDYAGVAERELEKEHAGATAMFLLGCAGDANPNPRGTVEHAEAHGQSLAGGVRQVLSGPMRPLRGPVRSVFDRVDLPFAVPAREEFERRAADPKDLYRQRHAQNMLAAWKEKGALPATYPYPIQVVKFGKDLTLVALAGEVVVDYALRLKRELGAEKLWVLGYSNDVFAYIASKRVLEEGGYEAATSMIYYGQPGPWAPSVEETLISKVHGLVRKLR